jgi:hypothetical protein
MICEAFLFMVIGPVFNLRLLEELLYLYEYIRLCKHLLFK